MTGLSSRGELAYVLVRRRRTLLSIFRPGVLVCTAPASRNILIGAAFPSVTMTTARSSIGIGLMTEPSSLILELLRGEGNANPYRTAQRPPFWNVIVLDLPEVPIPFSKQISEPDCVKWP